MVYFLLENLVTSAIDHSMHFTLNYNTNSKTSLISVDSHKPFEHSIKPQSANIPHSNTVFIKTSATMSLKAKATSVLITVFYANIKTPSHFHTMLVHFSYSDNFFVRVY